MACVREVLHYIFYIPGGDHVDLEKLQEVIKQMEGGFKVKQEPRDYGTLNVID